VYLWAACFELLFLRKTSFICWLRHETSTNVLKGHGSVELRFSKIVISIQAKEAIVSMANIMR
jgi:hypothetical protein